MDNTTVKLYFIQNLTEDKNFVLEDMAAFIAHYTPVLSLSNMQYMRLSKTQTLKIDKPQDWADVSAPLNLPNYCEIVNDATHEEPAYYFIVAIRQRAQQTVELALELDVLNTFKSRWYLLFTSKTRVYREHVDRYEAQAMLSPGTLKLYPIFSRTDEGETPKLVRDGAELTPIQDDKGGTSDVSFYLIYRTDENGRPCVDMAASKQLLIGRAGTPTPYSLPIANMVAGRYYYLMGDISFDINGRSQHVRSDNTPEPPEDADFELDGKGMLVFWKLANNYIAVSFVSDEGNLVELTGEWWEPSAAYYIDRYHWFADRGITIQHGKTLYYSNNLTYNQEEIESFDNIEINAGGSDVYLAPLSVLDLTDGNNVKVIECPYCPIDYIYDSQSELFTFDPNKFASTSPEGFMRSYNVGRISFKNNSFASVLLVSPFSYTASSATITAPKGTFKDPKEYTSPFYFHAFVYDSFAHMFKYEDLRKKSSPNFLYSDKIKISYKQSSAISSNLVFDFGMDASGNFEEYVREENFANVLPCSRNNEVPLYSSSYLEYIKNGYNYDKKKIRETAAQNATLSAVQLLGSVLSFALSGATGGLSAVAGVGLASSAISSLASQAGTYKQASADLEQKVNLLKAQSFTVSSIDDLDLFKYYGKNRLLHGVYHMQSGDKKRISDKFYFTGYAATRTGGPVRSRLYFDYFQADADFMPAAPSAYLSIGQLDEYLDEVKAKIAAGITLFWSSGLALQSWKLTQERENLELDIYEMLQ